MSIPTEADRDVCGRAIIASAKDYWGDALTSESKTRLFNAHNTRRMRGEGMSFGEDPNNDPELDITDLGFTAQDCGRINAYLHVCGMIWTQDADGWVCDCTGVEIEVRE